MKCGFLLLKPRGNVMTAYPDGSAMATMKLLESRRWKSCSTPQPDRLQRSPITWQTEFHRCHTLIWTAVSLGGTDGPSWVEQAAARRVCVEPTLQAAATSEVFVAGDSAYVEDESGQPLPMLATVAQQQAKAAARNIQKILRGENPEPFHYKDPGLLATIGRNAAVARIWGLSFSGFIAWVIWVGLHIFRLIGFRNRVVSSTGLDYFLYDNQVADHGE